MQKFAVIFDFNGTMLFDTQIQYYAWDMLAKETLGQGIDQRVFLRNANGRTSSETVDFFWGTRIRKQQKQELITRKREIYKEYCLSHPEEFRLADGIPEILDLLQENNVPFTIATSSNPKSVDFYFEHLQLGRWFRRKEIVCNDKQFPGKPAPDIYRYTVQTLDVPAEQCIVVEDAIAGTLAARAAGIGYIVLIDPEHDRMIRVGAQADLIIDSFDALYQLICDRLAE
ncbi:MAG: HAD family hydrolase [Butyricicoccus sp.]